MLILLLILGLTACADATVGPQASPNSTKTQGSTSVQAGNTTNGNGSVVAATGAQATATSTVTPFVLNPTPTAGPTPTPTNGGNLSGGVLQDASTLDYYQNNTQAGLSFVKLLFDAALTARDPQTLTVIPHAASTWTLDAGSKTVTFKLKDGLKWSDGQPLTAQDYVWTYQQARLAEHKWPAAAVSFYYPDVPGSEGIEAITAPTPTTLIVKLHLSQWTFDDDILSRADVIEPLPQHVWQDKSWSDPAQNPEILTPSVVSGPWKLKEWKPGDHLTFMRNSNSTLLPPPHLDSLTFKVVQDDLVALQALKDGSLDFYQPQAINEPAFAQSPNLHIYKWTPARPTWHFLGFNFRKPYLLDKALRQALAFATDRQTIIERGAFGLGAPLYSDVPPWSKLFDNSVVKYPYSLDNVRQILQEAGYLNKDGQLTTKDGQPFPTLKIAYNTPSQLHEQTAALLQEAWGKLGIKVEFKTFALTDFNRFLADPASDYDLFLSGWQSDYDVENLGILWQDNVSLNSGAYHNPQLLDLYAQAQHEPDFAKRRALMFQVQELENKDLPYIYLFAEYGWITVGPRVQGVNPTALGATYQDYSDWFVRPNS